MTRALILDFDGSVGALPGATVIPLQDRQEEIRFGCRRRSLDNLATALSPALAQEPSVVFLGSGDYHHVTLPLVERMRPARPIQVVVLDNHPDNMRYPFGVHCGSWVWHVSRLPFVSRVHVAGITSTDVEGAQVLANHLAPLRSGKVVYWCVSRDLRALARAGAHASGSFSTTAAMLEALVRKVSSDGEPVYLSIDKDVLAADVVQTNWDQGVMRLEEMEAAVGLLRERIIAADIVGDVSSYHYRGRFKRFLSALDRQPEIPDSLLEGWQSRHREVNELLLNLLAPLG